VDIVREEIGTTWTGPLSSTADGNRDPGVRGRDLHAVLNFSSVQVVNDNTGQVLDFPLDGKAKN
jgi:hypothetical protein